MGYSGTGKNRCLLTLLTLTILVCLAPGAYAQGFAGYWKSTFGHIDLERKGLRISGVYDDGKIRGTVKGVLTSDGTAVIGQWFEGDLKGKMVLRLQDGKNSFTGRWWRDNSGKEGKWIAVRVNTNHKFSSQNTAAETFAGSWETNFGRLSLTQAEEAIDGNFRGRVNNGTISGKFNPKSGQFAGTWHEKGQKGKVILSLLKGNNGLEGEWWYADGRYGGLWYGARVMAENPCTSGNCKNGKGALLLSDGQRYEGDFKEGAYHGIGRTFDDVGREGLYGLWANGIYQGKPLEGDCENGKGKLEMPSGDIYEGNFKDCQMVGEGRIAYKNGDVYVGKLSDGVPNGEGAYTWKYNGDRYEGAFRNGTMHGKGTYHFRNGNKYEGQFLSGFRHGLGTLTWIDGTTFSGEWKSDKATGKGEFNYKNGDRYVGFLIDGKKFDKGTYYFKDGREVAANWRDDEVEYLLDGPAHDGVGAQTHYGSAVDQDQFQDNNYIPVLAKDIQSRRNAYVAYQVTEKQQGAAKEVDLSYMVVYGADEMNQNEIREFVKSNLSPEGNGRFKLEQVNNPDVKVQQVINRYRYSLNQTRVHTNTVKYVELNDQVASNSNRK